MIAETQHNNMTPSENPPPYETLTSEVGAGGDQAFHPAPAKDVKDTKVSTPYQGNVGPSNYRPMSPPLPSMPPTTVYHYVHPVTGERVASLLPPDHPEMICLQEGKHVAETRYGLLGVLAAILWFPLGIGLCLLDRKVRCRRCGIWIDEGLC